MPNMIIPRNVKKPSPAVEEEVKPVEVVDGGAGEDNEADGEVITDVSDDGDKE